MKFNQKLSGTPEYLKVALRNFSKYILMVCILGSSWGVTFAQKASLGKTMEVGVARIDITPDGPIRLAGFGTRVKAESDGVILPLGAKALAFGSDAQGPSVLITVDLIGIPGHITNKVAERLSKKVGLDPARLAICASHTHSGPEVGTLLNILPYTADGFGDSMLPIDQMNHISIYVDQLTSKLEQVALAALKARKPSYVAWGLGQVNFAKNRRMASVPVDHSMPMLRVTDPDGKIRAILVNYACHAVALREWMNKIHGDWVGEAQLQIETKYPGAIAMVAVGCGGDANPSLVGMEGVEPLKLPALYGKMIANEVDSLLKTPLHPLTVAPSGRLKRIELPFAHVPDVQELVQRTSDKTAKGYYARLALTRIARGHVLPSSVSYPVQTWTFGKELAMVFLGGEAIARYSLRLKEEFGAQHLWVNAYSNDVPCYIPSRQALKEPAYRYETESSMYYYDKPSPFAEDVEERIITAVHDLMPKAFKPVGK